MNGLLSIVIPVRNEAANIGPMLKGVTSALTVPAEFLIVYDDESDSTLPVVNCLSCSFRSPGGQTAPDEVYRTVKNTIGPGPANALKAGFSAARGEAIVVMMADISDDHRALTPMIQKFESGYDLVCGSRYMPGGEQIGGPWLKGKLSRMAGLSLHTLGLPSHDATNSFKLYRTQRLRSLNLRSAGGFEINLEIIVKAWRAGWRITEVPTRWTDRTAGRSNFKLLRWLPRYLKWYAYALGVGALGPIQ